MSRNKGGRPLKIDQAILTKLEEAFLIGASDTQACFYAGISTRTLIRYEQRNPKYSHRKQGLKEQLLLRAKKKIATQITNDKDESTADSWRLLEKKDPEMKPVQKIEHAGLEGTPIPSILMNPKMKDAVKLFNEGLREQTINEIKKMP